MNSDFSIAIDDQKIATITWNCEKKSMNVLSFEALETLEKLIAHLTSYISSSCDRKLGSINGASSKFGEFNATLPKLFGRQEL